MALTESSFSWNGGSFYLGVILTLHLNTIASAFERCRDRFSPYFAAIIVLAVSHIITLVIIVAYGGQNDPTQPEGKVAPLTAGLNALAILLEHVTEVGFVSLNFFRLKKLAQVKYPLPIRIMTILVFLYMLGVTIHNIWFLVLLSRNDSLITMAGPASMFNLMSFYDGLLNAGISLGFVLYLRSVTLDPQFARSRSSLSSMLASVKYSLGFECAVIIAANLLQLVSPASDPLWIATYLSLALRLRIFTSFLSTLGVMLRQTNRSDGGSSITGGAAGANAAGTSNSALSQIPLQAGGGGTLVGSPAGISRTGKE
ncbi:hypothetical protein H9P43_005608 [Blastocladiella emersonii ATCC 22665]|nr:hypothetical protein H9P43_005608 [Blastocladiella emersonii ATCC 22665]